MAPGVTSVAAGQDRSVPGPVSDAPGGAETYEVELGGTRVTLAATRADPDGFRAVFERARAEVGHARCRCTAGRPRLVIRRHGGRYWLACWPGGGTDHDPGCRFFHDPTPPDSGRGGYTRAALHELGGGQARIRLEHALTARSRGAEPDTTASDGDGHSGGRTRMSLGGMLQYLWERAELNSIGPPRWGRDWAACARALHAVVAQLAVNGQDLAGSVYIVPPYQKTLAGVHKAVFRRFSNSLSGSRANVRRGLILGAIKDLSPSPHGYRIALRHHPVPLYLTAALHDRLARSARAAFSPTRPAGSERVLLALIETSPGGYHTIVAAAAMLTSRDHVPADSSHEVAMSGALAAARRPFVKPLRYDSTEAVFPDFLLVDADPPTPVEVWGITGRADYEARKRDKQQHYAQAGGTAGPGLLEWDVRDPIPAIPAAPL